MRGSFIGVNRYLVRVRVKGRLRREGGGWTPAIDGASVLSDYKK